MVFSLTAAYPGKKERVLNFVHVVQIFTELGKYQFFLAQENTENNIFLWDNEKES